MPGCIWTTNESCSASGSLLGTIAYHPFGATRSTSGNLPAQQFTGQRLDNTGLYYYNARYYDPEIGRFISADSIVQDFSNPQTLNRYAYCANNPLKYVDPSGHRWGQNISNVINYQNLPMIDTYICPQLPQFVAQVSETPEYQAYSAFRSIDPLKASQIEKWDQIVDIKYDNFPIGLNSTTRTHGTNSEIVLNNSLKGVNSFYIAQAINVSSADIVPTFNDPELRSIYVAPKIIGGLFGLGFGCFSLLNPYAPITAPLFGTVSIYGGWSSFSSGVNHVAGYDVFQEIPKLPIPPFFQKILNWVIK